MIPKYKPVNDDITSVVVKTVSHTGARHSLADCWHQIKLQEEMVKLAGIKQSSGSGTSVEGHGRIIAWWLYFDIDALEKVAYEVTVSVSQRMKQQKCSISSDSVQLIYLGDCYQPQHYFVVTIQL